MHRRAFFLFPHLGLEAGAPRDLLIPRSYTGVLGRSLGELAVHGAQG